MHLASTLEGSAMIPFSPNPTYSEIKPWFRGRLLLANADVMALAQKIRPLTVVDGRLYYYLKVTSAHQSLVDPAAVGVRVQRALEPYVQFYTFHRNNGTAIRPTLSEVFAGYDEKTPYNRRDF